MKKDEKRRTVHNVSSIANSKSLVVVIKVKLGLENAFPTPSAENMIFQQPIEFLEKKELSKRKNKFKTLY